MSNKDFWICVLKRLQPTISKSNFLTWFQHSTALANENGVLVVGLPTTFLLNNVEQRFALKIFQAAKEFDASIVKVRYEVVSGLKDGIDPRAVDVKNLVSEENDKKVRKVKNLNEVVLTKGNDGNFVHSQMLNNRYRLSNFMVGLDNRLPHAAASAVAHAPGGIYNPLYVYGVSGVGKTHLIQAVGNEILRNLPDRVVQYMTAERFVSEVVEAIGKRHMKNFKDRYRKVDVFLIDDVQFFIRKDSSQQEFFHTFNELYEANKQIVITSDRAPSELDGLDGRLKSRFGMGMVVELLAPDFETRVAILNQKCKEYQVLIDPEILMFIANNVKNNVRELEGVLRQIVADIELAKKLPSINSVVQIIKKMNKAQEIIGYDLEKKKVAATVRTTKEVMEIVARYFNVTVEQLVGEARHSNLMRPRQICMYLIKNELGETYQNIGYGFGGRNHTTVMHACNKTAKKLRTDLKLIRDVNAIKRELGV